MTDLSSRRVYDVWTRLIQDEELYEAMLAGTHGRLEGRGLSAEDIAILDRFRAEPGTRWNIENLRFRSSLDDKPLDKHGLIAESSGGNSRVWL